MRLTLPVTVLLIGVICSAAFANQSISTRPAALPLPHSITALAAIHKARIAIAHARHVYRLAIAAARRQEARQLKLAEHNAMHRNDLKDAVLINKWVKYARKMNARRSSTGGLWNNQGVELRLASGHRVFRSDVRGQAAIWYRLRGSHGDFVVIYTRQNAIDLCKLSGDRTQFVDRNATLSAPWIVHRIK